MTNEAIYQDAFNLLCGDLIGEGTTRKVFACRLRHELVVKVEIDKFWRDFANVVEMRFWQFHVNDALRKWLAPCDYLSPDGRILLQRRADPLPRNYELPEKIPAFLNDLKRDNFGLIDGNLVCVDYALAITKAPGQIVNAKWWTEKK